MDLAYMVYDLEGRMVCKACSIGTPSQSAFINSYFRV